MRYVIALGEEGELYGYGNLCHLCDPKPGLDKRNKRIGFTLIKQRHTKQMTKTCLTFLITGAWSGIYGLLKSTNKVGHTDWLLPKALLFFIQIIGISG